jgi:hypothetical protein
VDKVTGALNYLAGSTSSSTYPPPPSPGGLYIPAWAVQLSITSAGAKAAQLVDLRQFLQQGV